MTKKMFQTLLILALLFPIIILAGLTLYKIHILESGKEVTLKISGYDPRDLLSGHYVIYTVNYGISNLCNGVTAVGTAYVCLSNKTYSFSKPKNCELYIRGVCRYGRFEAGIERYFIPEDAAASLDKEVRADNGSILIVVNSNGYAQVKNLLINGKPWR